MNEKSPLENSVPLEAKAVSERDLRLEIIKSKNLEEGMDVVVPQESNSMVYRHKAKISQIGEDGLIHITREVDAISPDDGMMVRVLKKEVHEPKLVDMLVPFR